MHRPPEPKRIAFRTIMNHLTEFSMAQRHRDGQEWPPMEGYAFRPSDGPPKVGQLVILTAKPMRTEWYLSWVVEVEPGEPYVQRTLLESCETGKLAWWANVGFHVFEGKAIHENWRWTDRQWAFSIRWDRTFQRGEDSYVNRVGPTTFGPDGRAVTIRVRTMFENEVLAEHTYPDFRKVLTRNLAAMRDTLCAEAARKRKAKRAVDTPHA